MKLKTTLLLVAISLLFACKKDAPDTSHQSMLLTKIRDDRGTLLTEFKWSNGKLIQLDDAGDKYTFTYDAGGRIVSIDGYDLVTGVKRETINQLKFNDGLLEEFVQDQIGNSNYRIYKLSYLNNNLTKAVTNYYDRSNHQLISSDTRFFAYNANGTLTEYIGENGQKTVYLKYDDKKPLLSMLPAWFYLIKGNSVNAIMGVDFQNALPQNGNLLEAGGNGYSHKFIYEYNAQGYPVKITRSSSENNVEYYSDSYTYEYQGK